MIYRSDGHGEESSDDEVGGACDRRVGRREGRDQLEHICALIG
jgi:hypothetical protein